jgi:DNA invertase Pin-like site-specific DNA recombinase
MEMRVSIENYFFYHQAQLCYHFILFYPPNQTQGGFMVYAYVRVSTDRQSVENQRYEIRRFCKNNEMIVDKWVEESISGTASVDDRGLGRMLKKMASGDILICSELSRLGRNLLMIMGILNQCMERDIQVWTIKDKYRLGNDISCKVLAFAFGLSAEIERELISQRTKEALARKKDEGIVLGRPKGSKSKSRKLTGREAEVKALLKKNVSKSAIARVLGVNRSTISKFINEEAKYIK